MTTPQDGAGVSNSQVPDLQSAVSKAVADSMSTLSAQISSVIDVRFENFKTQFSQENSASENSASLPFSKEGKRAAIRAR